MDSSFSLSFKRVSPKGEAGQGRLLQQCWPVAWNEVEELEWGKEGVHIVGAAWHWLSEPKESQWVT